MSETRRIYAGIGSRRTPDDTLALMTQFAAHLEIHGWTLRTGGAPGADQAFMTGTDPAATELYLPWPGFENYDPGVAPHFKVYMGRPTPWAYDISSEHHPAWHRLSRGAMALQARNAHQVLGEALDDPVLMIVCWTPDGSLDGTGRDTGGTGQALRIATARTHAKVFNLARDDHRARIERILG